MWVKSRVLGLLASVALLAATAPATDPPDPFLWLEDVHGARAQAWVKAENAKTLAVLQRDPHFAGFYAAARAVNGAKDRIPVPAVTGGAVYNFWQDAAHVRGIWRTTSIAITRPPAPQWKTVLDLDALAKDEGKNWAWQGADCDAPSGERCLIFLSEGGEDASTVREFDLPSRTFVAGGFSLPHGKQTVAWADDDTLLVARAWQPGELTTSGYPYVVKSLKRGQALDDAVEIARGHALRRRGHARRTSRRVRATRLLTIDRGVSFFESQQRSCFRRACGA